MERSHSETWYRIYIWRLLETWFDKLKDLEAAIEEPISMANQDMADKKRTVEGLDTIIARVKSGRKYDSVFCTYKIGATDSFVKLPTTLDMLDDHVNAKHALYKPNCWIFPLRTLLNDVQRRRTDTQHYSYH